jgi:hypothetical protein
VLRQRSCYNWRTLAKCFNESVLSLWRLSGTSDEHGKAAPHWLQFTSGADAALRDFEGWLEPQLAEGEELSFLAGWANKLAGAIVRIAGTLHMAGSVAAGQQSQRISDATVGAAIELGRGYLLPHAKAAFGIMGADEAVETARRVWNSIFRHSESNEYSESTFLSVSRRDIHQWNRRLFQRVEDLDPILDILVKHGLMRADVTDGHPGRGHKSPAYSINPIALAAAKKEAPRTHCAQRSQSGQASEDSECSEHALASQNQWGEI